MVQLRVCILSLKGSFTREFQFQYGSIKSLKAGKMYSTGLKFQFQYGSIKRMNKCKLHYFRSVFQFQYGSIKRKIKIQTFGKATPFQFQYGSIKSKTFFSSDIVFACFNSNMVQLREKKFTSP